MEGALKLAQPTWFIGCGNMGGAIIDGWRLGALDLSPVTVIRPSGRPVEGVRVVNSLNEAGMAPRMAILAFKPQKLDEIAPELSQSIGPATVIVSLLAGVECETLRHRFPGAGPIVRATPNLPVAVRRGVTGLYGVDADGDVKRGVNDIFAALGYVMWMAGEDKLGALGSVAGAGPAYVARFIAALTKAGVKRGLTEDTAATLAVETVLGTAWMASTRQESMESIARRVASPNGTTEAGLRILDSDHVLDQLVALTIDAAAERGSELAAEARAASLAETGRLH